MPSKTKTSKKSLVKKIKKSDFKKPKIPEPKPNFTIVSEKAVVQQRNLDIKKINNFKKKDNIILILFIFSFLLFIFSIYISFFNWNKNNSNLNFDIQKNIENIQTWNNLKVITSTNVVKLSPQKQLIIDFYSAINANNFWNLSNMLTKNLKSSNVFRTYYNTRWLSAFLWWIKNNVVYLTWIQETQLNTNQTQINYILNYKLLNSDQEFFENWTVVVVQQNWYKIGKIMCDTKWCSKMPFFNPTKYGIR